MRPESPVTCSDVPVLARPSIFEPGRDLRFRAPLGSSIAEIVDQAIPAAKRLPEVAIRAFIGGVEIEPEHFHRVRPKVGTKILIVAEPGGDDGFRVFLQVAVVVAAIAAGQFYVGSAFAATLGSAGISATVGSTIISTSVLIAGNLLISALVPPRTDEKDKPIYAVQGTRNQMTPNGVLPLVLGKVRYAPPYATTPYTEAVRDERYVTAAFACACNPVVARNWKIGQTPIERYKNVQLEFRQGLAGDERLTLVKSIVLEEQLSIQLQTSTLATGGPQIRVTDVDCTACSFDITFPGGLFATNEDGEFESWTVDVGVRYRRVGVEDWTSAPTVSVTSNKRKQIVRTVQIVFPERGRYEIELSRTTTDWDEADQSKRKTKRSGRSFWSALRSIKPEYPIDCEFPVALAAARIRASGQLNGGLETLSAEFSSLCPDWDSPTQTWITRETSNPASLFRYVLTTSPAVTYPLTLDEIDDLSAWHAFCAAKGLAYNRVHDYEASVLDVLSDIAAAGRATPRNGGARWGAVIDRALDYVSAHISPRNSWGFESERAYTVYPDAFRVSFLDETNDYAQAERIVPWPGFTGTPRVLEKLELPGITSPDLIWKEARRRQYEIIHRPDTFTVSQDFEHLVIERGDRVQLNHDVLDRAQKSARLVRAADGIVVLDDFVAMEEGRDYAFWFQRPDGTSISHSVRTDPGQTKVLKIMSAGPLPEIPDKPGANPLVFFGPSSRVSLACTVKAIEAMDHLTARLTLIPHAPEIEALVDAEIPPPWSGRAGGEAQVPTGAPATPIVESIVSGRLAQGVATEANPYPVLVNLAQGAAGAVSAAAFGVRHRLQGAVTWLGPVTAPVAAGAVMLSGYAKGQIVEVLADAISQGGTHSLAAAIETHTVAATDAPVPVNLAVTIERRVVSGQISAAFLRLTCDPITRTDLGLVGRYRKVGTSAWLPIPRSATSLSSILSDVLTDGDAFEVQGATATAGGADTSDYIAAAGSPITATADPVAPAAPTFLSTARAASTNTVNHSGRMPNSGNARSMRLTRARGYGKTVADGAVVDTQAGAPNATLALSDVIDLGLYRYWLNAANGSGVASAAAGPNEILAARQLGNVLTAPDDMTNAAWVKFDVTPTLSGTGPDGVTMSLLTEGSGSGSHRVQQALTFPGGATSGRARYAQGIKAAGRTRGRLYIFDAAGSSYVYAAINLTAGTIGAPVYSGSGVTLGAVEIERVASDVYVAMLTATVAATGCTARLYLADDTGTTVYAGGTGKGLYAWAASLAVLA